MNSPSLPAAAEELVASEPIVRFAQKAAKQTTQRWRDLEFNNS